MQNVKTTRPNLSFITSQKFNNWATYNKWSMELMQSENLTCGKAERKLPELLQIAEMFFDANVHNPESIAFQMVSKVLNEIKES